MTRSHTDVGPGTRWLAARAGVTPEKLLHDPVRLLEELARATRETAELTAATASPDPEARWAAQQRATDLQARLTAGPTPSQRFGAALARALREQAERLGGEGEVPNPVD